MNTTTTFVTVTIPNLTPFQAGSIAKLVATWDAQAVTGDEAKTDPTVFAAPKKTRTTKSATPAKTVSEDEDEEFGTSEIRARDLNSDDGADSDEDEDDSEDEENLTFDTVKTAINQWGEKNPKSMRTILESFDVETTKELKASPKKWEGVYRKVMSKLKK